VWVIKPSTQRRGRGGVWRQFSLAQTWLVKWDQKIGVAFTFWLWRRLKPCFIYLYLLYMFYISYILDRFCEAVDPPLPTIILPISKQGERRHCARHQQTTEEQGKFSCILLPLQILYTSLVGKAWNGWVHQRGLNLIRFFLWLWHYPLQL
jgi:hypothetical protein